MIPMYTLVTQVYKHQSTKIKKNIISIRILRNKTIFLGFRVEITFISICSAIIFSTAIGLYRNRMQNNSHSIYSSQPKFNKIIFSNVECALSFYKYRQHKQKKEIKKTLQDYYIHFQYFNIFTFLYFQMKNKNMKAVYNLICIMSI